jgi:hypothetical protein
MNWVKSSLIGGWRDGVEPKRSAQASGILGGVLSTLRRTASTKRESLIYEHMSASTGCGHACRIGLGRDVP